MLRRAYETMFRMVRTPSSVEYRLLVENSPVMIWRAGLDAACDYFNETWLAFTGRTLEQEIGNGWAEGVHPDDFNQCVAYYLDHFHRRESFEMEYRLRRHDGVYRWILDRGVPFNNDDGVFAGYIGSCVDVHERRWAQESEKQQNQTQLEDARSFEKWVLTIVGHDIRNPLNAIQLAADGLEAIHDPAGTIAKHVETVTRGVDRIQHIVDDLLDVSRERERGGIPIHPKPVDLRVLAQRVIDEVAPKASDRNIVLDCDCDASGLWDEHRVLQAVSNLVANAAQHGVSGSTIRVHIIGDQHCVNLEVSNDGSIPEDLLPRIFEPFHSSRYYYAKPSGGLGLGLFIVKAISRAHGGTIGVTSFDGRTVFRLELPRGLDRIDS